MQELSDLERETFRTARDDGLFDVMMAAIVSMFALAPLLSESLGDFWSSAVFGPFWFAIYLGIRVVRLRIVAPRVGTIELGVDRRSRMRRINGVLLAVNAVAFGVGTAAAIGFGPDWLDLNGLVYPIILGPVALVIFSLVAYATSTGRYALYGLMFAFAPFVGEWLWQNDLAEHHGFPVVFGAASLIILATGITRLATLLRRHPLPTEPASV